MNHQQAEELFLEYIDRRISAADEKLISAHLEQCEQCCNALVEYRDVFDLEREIAAESYTPGSLFGDEVMQAINKESDSQEAVRLTPVVPAAVGRPWGVYFISGAAALTVVGLLLISNQSPGPYGGGYSGAGSSSEAAFHDDMIHTGIGNAALLIEGAFGALIMVGALLAALITLFWPRLGRRRRTAWTSAFVTVSAGMFMLRATVTLYFGTHFVDYEADGSGSSHAFSEAGFQDDLIRSGVSRVQRALGGSSNSSDESVSEPNYPPAARQPLYVEQSPPSQEQYRAYPEQGVELVAENPLSTFSLDVDTGSYSNVRRILNSNQLPPPDAVRVEELINYFPYNYPAPARDPIAVDYAISPSPFTEGKYLLRVGMRAKAAGTLDGGWNLVFLIDVSGSMDEPQKLPLLKASLLKLVDKMRPVDRIGIVTYADSASTVLESTPGTNKEAIRQAVQVLTPGGSTNGGEGIQLAYGLARQNRVENGVNRIILATDGDFNVGVTSFEALLQLVENERQDGISLTTLGFGAGNYKEENLEQLADKGNGNYFYIDSLKEGERVMSRNLTSNMEIVAKDVKAQIEFNPQHVYQYRLLGYDNRALAASDFTDDSIDAGEVGSAHTVTAIYELVLTKGRSGGASSEAELQPGTAADEFGFMKIRYKQPNAWTSDELTFPIHRSLVRPFSESDADSRFAVAVAYFGGVLHGSEFARGIGLGKVAPIAIAAAEGKSAEHQEFLELLKRAAKLRGESLPVPRDQLRYGSVK